MDDDSEESLPVGESTMDSHMKPDQCRLKLWKYFHRSVKPFKSGKHPEAYCKFCREKTGTATIMRGDRLYMMRHVKRCRYIPLAIKRELEQDANTPRPKVDLRVREDGEGADGPSEFSSRISFDVETYEGLPANDEEMKAEEDSQEEHSTPTFQPSNGLKIWKYFRKGPGKYRGGHHSIAHCIACHDATGELAPLRRERERLVCHANKCLYMSEEAKNEIRLETSKRQSTDLRSSGYVEKAPRIVYATPRPPSPVVQHPEVTAPIIISAAPVPVAVKPKQLDLDVVNACVSAGIPFSALSDSHVLRLFKSLSPTAQIAGVEDITGDVLDSVVQEMKKNMGSSLVNRECVTLHVCMWNDSRNRFVTGLVASVRDGSSSDGFLLSVSERENQTSPPKMLMNQVIEAVEILQNEHTASVVSVVLPSVCGRIHRPLQERYPSFVILPSYFQRFNGITKKALESLHFRELLDKALSLLDCIFRDDLAAEQFRKVQLIFSSDAMVLTKPMGKDWKTYDDCFLSIMENKNALQDFSRDENTAMSIDLQLLLEDDTFWSGLENLHHTVLPLTTAQLSLQSEKSSLCTILPCLQSLYKAFTSISDLSLRAALLSPLEEFWQHHCDQKLLVTACALNVDQRLSVVKTNAVKWMQIGSWALKLYEQVFKCRPEALLPSIGAYREEEEPFDKDSVQQWKARGQVHYWKYVKEVHPELADLAMFLLRITPSAPEMKGIWSSTERTCSQSTSTERMIDVARIKMKLMNNGDTVTRKRNKVDDGHLETKVGIVSEKYSVTCGQWVADYLDSLNEDMGEEQLVGGEANKVGNLDQLFG